MKLPGHLGNYDRPTDGQTESKISYASDGEVTLPLRRTLCADFLLLSEKLQEMCQNQQEILSFSVPAMMDETPGPEIIK